MKVLLSIKPEFAEKIFTGIKRYEYRKVVYANRSIKTIVVYATRPMSRIVGEFDVNGIIEATPDCLWKETQAYSGVDREFFDAYFTGRNKAFAICVGAVRKYQLPVVPQQIIQRFVPPQSYMYVSDSLNRPSSSPLQLGLF